MLSLWKREYGSEAADTPLLATARRAGAGDNANFAKAMAAEAAEGFSRRIRPGWA
jgi:hypothetical protein